VTQGGVAVQFGDAGVEGNVAQGDGQQHHPPEPGNGVIIAALATGGLQAGDQFLIGDGVEKVAEGNEGGMVFEFAPGEEWFGGVDAHDGPPWRKEAGYSARDRPWRGRLG
jgi:hypothetical protein